MKLHELSPAPGSSHEGQAHRAEAAVPATARLPARAIRARRPVRAAVCAPGFEGGQMPLTRDVSQERLQQHFCYQVCSDQRRAI